MDKRKFSETLFASMQLERCNLNCEEDFYHRQLTVSDRPAVFYQFKEQRGSQKRTTTQPSRHKKSSSRKTTQGPDNAEADRPFSSSLRRRIELRSKEKICFAGLKKKVARLYRQSLRHLDREADPPKRKRGRPRKDSSKPQINLPVLPEAGPRQVQGDPSAKLISMQGEAAVMSDEQLALQLHWDLNIPMLRRRRRSSGLSNVSNSEQ